MFLCEYCGRNNFKTSRGLTQHLNTNSICHERHTAAVSGGRTTRSQRALANAEAILEQQEDDTDQEEDCFPPPDSPLQHDMSATPATRSTPVADNDLLGVHESLAKMSIDRGTSSDSDDETQNSSRYDSDSFDLSDDVSSSEGKNADLFGYISSNDEGSYDGPNLGIRHQFQKFAHPSRFFAPLTPTDESGIRLLDALRLKKAPMNAYRTIFEWHLRESRVLKANHSLKDAGDHYIGRKALLRKLQRRTNTVGKEPYERTVRLPSSKEVVKIPCHDARDCIQRLLTDPRLTDEDFNFFDDDPLAPPPENMDYVEDCITGDAYRATYEQLIDPDPAKRQQLMGVLFYIDSAVTGQFSNLPVNALKMSLTCFTKKARMKDHCWVPLGYVPQIRQQEARGKKIFKDSLHLDARDMEVFDGEGEQVEGDDREGAAEDTDVKAQDFHTILSVILSSYVDLEFTGFLWDMGYKGKLTKDIDYQLAVMFIKCDSEEGDMNSGKYKPHTQNIKHICRACHIPTQKADKCLARYPYKTKDAIEKLVKAGKKDKLQEISQHYLNNAWYKVRFHLANNRGVHGATPSEMLHAILLGMFQYIRDIFFVDIGESAQVAFDINGLARVFGKLFSHQSERSMPSTNFSKGIKEGKLMAKEYRGVLLIMAAVIRSTKGRELLGTKRKFRTTGKQDDWLMLVELMLQWEAYLNEPRMLRKHVKRMDKKHRFLMYVIKQVARRTKGMGLKIVKFHTILHLMDDILLYGVPSELDTGANESHHKRAKYAAKLTQRNEATFNIQTAQRLFEFHVLDLALLEVDQDLCIRDYYQRIHDFQDQKMEEASNDSDQSDDETLTDDAQIEVFHHQNADTVGFKMHSRSKKANETTMDTDLNVWLVELQDKVERYISDSCLPIRTRHVRGGQIFHGHPNYRGKGPWKDWAIVDWGRQGGGRLPCHISCFVLLNGLPPGFGVYHGGVRLKNGVYAVVESSTYETDPEQIKVSDLFTPLLKDVEGFNQYSVVDGRIFYLADVEAIVGPCCVIPDIGGPANRYFQVKPRSEWPEIFTKWLQSPHEDEDISDSDSEN